MRVLSRLVTVAWHYWRQKERELNSKQFFSEGQSYDESIPSDIVQQGVIFGEARGTREGKRKFLSEYIKLADKKDKMLRAKKIARRQNPRNFITNTASADNTNILVFHAVGVMGEILEEELVAGA